MKVHVWAGISVKGATGVCIFEGIMDTALYLEILDTTLVPFLHEAYPQGHHFMQDNDPKHTSTKTQEYFVQNGINWWRTPPPPESPDMNPIENLRHELKEHMRREVKPQNKDQLISGIQGFWESVTPAKCTRYIRHLRKVLPPVIEVEGGY